MTATNDGGPAYPVIPPQDEHGIGGASGYPYPDSGMSLRDHFAGQALSGCLDGRDPKHAASVCYALADAMIAAREAYTINPLQAELDQARAQVESLESLRPHWAQGYSSDSIAAQSATSALSDIWQILGVQHQTAALDRIRKLLELEISK